jgi:hypothetical protein
MKLVELHWNDNKEEGFVKFVKGFDEINFVTKLDMLKDCIYDLEEKYNSILTTTEKREHDT